MIAATRCDAQSTRGCRARVPEVPNVSGGLAADPAVHTTYVASSATAVAMIDDSTCNAFHTAGCAKTPPSVTVGTNPAAIARLEINPVDGEKVQALVKEIYATPPEVAKQAAAALK